MAYQSLYRRYRPQRFDEVRGQPYVVTALRNAVRDGRTAHAYLFSGPRGTGKTSTARILAKALNCTDLHDGEPCGECESCTAIEGGTSYDLHELDAASNNGVDAVRDLIEKTSYGTAGRTKVYILDEVHMLSRAASNALLKTLEEPPAHVVFVLATTDPQKVLPTIRSRTQHFEFHLLPMDELAEHVRWVAQDAGLSVDDAAVTHVLRAGGGSARDTLSALDQVVAAGGVLDGTGGLDGLVDALCAADAGAALVAVDEALAAGRDARLVGEELLARLRDVFLCRMGVPLDRLPEADRERVAGWAQRLGDRAVTRAMELLGDAITEISHQALDPRVSLEVALLRIARPEADANVEALAARLDRVEKALAQGGTLPPATEAGAAPAAPSGVDTAGASEAVPAAPRRAPSGDGSGAATARAALADRRQSRGGGSRRTASADTASGGQAPAAPPSVPPSAPPSPDAPPATPAAANDRSAEGAAPSAPAADAAPAKTAGNAEPAPLSGGAGAAKAPRAEPGGSPDGAASPAASEPPPSEAPAASAGGGLPSRDVLTVAWADSILPGLSGLTRAMFSVGRFLEDGGGAAAVFALPNAVHRDKCEAKRADVETALATHFGHPVPLQLVVDEAATSGGGGNGGGRPAGGRGTSARGGDRRGADGGAAPAGDPFAPADQGGAGEPEEEEAIDVASLEDAPPDPRTPIDRITEVFPGARVEPQEGP